MNATEIIMAQNDKPQLYCLLNLWNIKIASAFLDNFLNKFSFFYKNL